MYPAHEYILFNFNTSYKIDSYCFGDHRKKERNTIFCGRSHLFTPIIRILKTIVTREFCICIAYYKKISKWFWVSLRIRDKERVSRWQWGKWVAKNFKLYLKCTLTHPCPVIRNCCWTTSILSTKYH